MTDPDPASPPTDKLPPLAQATPPVAPTAIEGWFDDERPPPAPTPPAPPAVLGPDVLEVEIVDEIAASLPTELVIETPGKGPPVVMPRKARMTMADLPEARRVPRGAAGPNDAAFRMGDSSRGPAAPTVFTPRGTDELDLPKPKVLQAGLVILGTAVVFGLGLVIILYAIWAGFKKTAKPRTPAVPQAVEPAKGAGQK